VVTVKAKEGYAVGSITVKAGLFVDGISVTYMRVVNGKLVLSDSYQSEWFGRKDGGKDTTLGGDGTAVAGIIGKANNTDCTRFGLLLKKS
jgi:hypothetical protein